MINITEKVKSYYVKMYLMLGKEFDANQLNDFYEEFGSSTKICGDREWYYLDMKNKGYATAKGEARGFTDKFIEDFING